MEDQLKKLETLAKSGITSDFISELSNTNGKELQYAINEAMKGNSKVLENILSSFFASSEHREILNKLEAQL